MTRHQYRCSLWELFFVFAKIGAVTFGGGMIMLPLIQKSIVENKKWLDDDEFIDIITVTNSAPGALAVNAAVYIGFKLRGLLGAIISALGAIIPSFAIILIIAFLITNGKNYKILNNFFYGVRPAVVALIVYAAFKLRKSGLKTIINWIFLASALGLLLIGLNPIFVILAGALGGMVFQGLRKPAEKEGAP